ncbi:hypothetical protein [Rhodococcus aetherivorans]
MILVACGNSSEAAARISVEKNTVTVGEPLTYQVEMLDAGAQGVLNLIAEQGYFLLPWQTADLRQFTADATGQVEGSIATDDIPPGRYRLVFACSTGCSQLRPMSEAPKVTMPDGSAAAVSDGPEVTIRSDSNAVVTVTGAGQPTLIRVAGTGFPPSTEVEIVVSLGVPFASGLPLLTSEAATTDANGSFTHDVTVSERASRNTVYVGVGERILASTEFS